MSTLPNEIWLYIFQIAMADAKAKIEELRKTQQCDVCSKKALNKCNMCHRMYCDKLTFGYGRNCGFKCRHCQKKTCKKCRKPGWNICLNCVDK